MRIEFTVPEQYVTDTGDGLAIACGTICQRLPNGTLITNAPKYTFGYWSFMFTLSKLGGQVCRTLF